MSKFLVGIFLLVFSYCSAAANNGFNLGSNAFVAGACYSSGTEACNAGISVAAGRNSYQTPIYRAFNSTFLCDLKQIGGTTVVSSISGQTCDLVCPSGQGRVNGACGTCPSGTTQQADGSCGCPAGTQLFNGACVSPCVKDTSDTGTTTWVGGSGHSTGAFPDRNQCINQCNVFIGATLPIFPSGSNCQYFSDTDKYSCAYRGWGDGTHCSTSSSAATQPTTTTPVATSPTTTTTTTTKDSSGNTTGGGTTSSKTTTTVNTDGSTTTTTTTTNPDGSTTIVATRSGSSGKGVSDGTSGTGTSTGTGTGTGTGSSGTGLANKGDDMSAGQCDPRSADYQKCVGLLKDAPSDKGQSFIDAQAGVITQKLTDHENERKADIDSVAGIDVPGPDSVFGSLMSVLPQSVSCAPITLNFPGHPMVIQCDHFETFKAIFAWFLYVATFIYIFRLVSQPIEA
ncbi:MAG: hypothetical protein JWM78_460 [Verrucomicrobiaceae bacterium]|nr:hypothetical protein [Verrucomicrobiaceae bacterium]